MPSALERSLRLTLLTGLLPQLFQLLIKLLQRLWLRPFPDMLARRSGRGGCCTVNPCNKHIRLLAYGMHFAFGSFEGKNAVNGGYAEADVFVDLRVDRHVVKRRGQVIEYSRKLL